MDGTIIEDIKFKSYYVVWKHDMIANKSISNFFGLNRTM